MRHPPVEVDHLARLGVGEPMGLEPTLLDLQLMLMLVLIHRGRPLWGGEEGDSMAWPHLLVGQCMVHLDVPPFDCVSAIVYCAAFFVLYVQDTVHAFSM